MSPKRYQHRVSEVVEAIEVVEAMEITPETIDRAVNWSKGRQVEEINPFDPDGPRLVGINVLTEDGVIRVSERDFLVLNRGTFERVSRGEFQAEFELVAL